LHNDFIVYSHGVSFLARLKVSHALCYLEGLNATRGLRSRCCLDHRKCALEVEKLYKLVDVEVLCGLVALDILNYHVLIQLEAILHAHGGKEGLHDLCDLPVVLAVLLEPRDPIGHLARLYSLLHSPHHLLHLLQGARQ
jgi:hypothetical protein